jgi:hypothetical protein
MFIGYRYECVGCGKVLADTSVGPDGRLRGEGNPGGFFPGRQFTKDEQATLGLEHAEHAHFEAGVDAAPAVREMGVEEPPGRFQRWMEEQEKSAKEVADLVKPLGFEFYHTGGGCTAWVLRGMLDGRRVEAWSTDGNLSASEKLTDPFMVVIVPLADDGEPLWENGLFEHTYRNVRFMLKALGAKRLRLPTPTSTEVGKEA